MTEIATATTQTPDLRGRVLVAHYAFRKEVGSRGGDEKGACTTAAAKHRETKNPAALHEMLYHGIVLSHVNKVTHYVGSPGEVPTENFTAFLQQKLDALHAAYNNAFQELSEATLALGRAVSGAESTAKALRDLAAAQARVEAHAYLLQTFVRHFSPALRELAGA